MLDIIEQVARRIAAKGYLLVAFAAFVYIVLRASWRVTLAAAIMLGAFVTYCVLEDDDVDDDE